MAEDGESRRFQEENREYYETRPSSVTGVSDSQQTSVNKTTPPRDMYWFAHTADPFMERTLQAKKMPLITKKEDSVDAHFDYRYKEFSDERNANALGKIQFIGNKKQDILHRSGSPASLDAYWFAHGGVDETSANVGSDPDASAAAADGKEPLLQKEREERIRIFREQQEEERRKRLQDLEQSFMVARKYREQQEEDRRRKIEEARIKEIDRRQQVEERKRQIWEAEQERKEAILRRNLEREARIEARRNAQRNSMSFAFGSSTPRTFDLDLAALGNGRGPAQVLLTATSGRRSEEREFGPGAKRATSACSLDRKFEIESAVPDGVSDESRENSRESSLEPSPCRINISKQLAIEHMKSDETKACLTMLDSNTSHNPGYHPYFFDNFSPGWLTGSGVLVGDDCMSRSMVSLSSVSRGRRRTDLIPTVPRERSTTPFSISRGNQSMRAVSMTRLDQLAQPRRRYFEATRESTMASSPTKSLHTASPNMSKSMCNLSNSTLSTHPVRKLTGTPTTRGGGIISCSMLHLPQAPQKSRTTSPHLSPSSSKSLSPTHPLPMLRSAQSMTHLAFAPRPTRASRLRADALANAHNSGRTTSMLNLCKTETFVTGRLMLSVAKDSSHSPSRPRSSMSGTSEISTTSSQTSAVSLRPRPAPRRPRPLSYAGTMSEHSSATAASPVAKQLERQARPTGRIATNSVPKPPRAKSAGPEQHIDEPVKPTCARKPVPPPKTSEVLAKAKPHPPITRDNLRKVPNVPNPSPKINPSLQNTIVPENSNVVPSNKDETQEVKNVSEEKLDNGFKAVKEIVPPSQQEIIGDVSSIEEVTPSGKTRITSEEEAKAALAEKRRVAREQAEKEAELERQRQEEIRLQEEERKRQEELEQKRLEEEQLRLAEMHRKMEEEKLKKAIEEQQQREKEERERKEEEMRLKAEKDEQEKKAREEAERQRLELEERLRKEEEERAERKRRVEQIMSRTRGKSAQPSGSSQPNSQAGSKSVSPVEDRKVLPTDDNQSAVNSVVTVVDQDLEFQKQKIINNNVSENKTEQIVNEEQKEILNVQFSNIAPTDKFIEIPQPHPYNNKTGKSEQERDGVMFDIHKSNTVVKNGLHEENLQQSLKTNISNEIVHGSNRTVQSEDIVFAMQTNGYSSHEETSCTTSPEDQSEKSDSSSGLVLDFGSGQQPLAGDSSEQTEFEQLIDLGAAPSANAHNENFLMNADDVNSNIIPPGIPFIAFEDNMSKKQETSITDLLS